jgi:chemotaxis protein MotB
LKNVRILAKESYHEEESEGTWALSYGDMITLLLSFFVIFFTTDPQKENTQKLNNLLSFELEGAKALGKKSKDSAQAGGRQKVELKDIPELEGVSIKAHQVDENIVITFGMTSFFMSGSIIPSEKGLSVLKIFSEKYLPFAGNYRLSIKGFTDTKPVTKKRGRRFEDNLELSALRSISVMKVLQKAGIPLNRMEIAGAGELALMQKVLPDKKGLTEDELSALSRTINLVITPENPTSDK